VIFDMDGLLIDTEPLWRLAMRAVFRAAGVEVTDAELLNTTGQLFAEVLADWRLPRGPLYSVVLEVSDEELLARATEIVVAEVGAGWSPMPGVALVLAQLRERGLHLAIASSSPPRMIQTVCDRLGLADITVRCSGVDESRGKPAPDIFLTAAARLGVAPEHCLVLEDSPRGVTAAKAAGMWCIAVPDRLLVGDPKYLAADLVLGSLEEFDTATLQRMSSV
jgi:sugar-phosphatase